MLYNIYYSIDQKNSPKKWRLIASNRDAIDAPNTLDAAEKAKDYLIKIEGWAPEEIEFLRPNLIGISGTDYLYRLVMNTTGEKPANRMYFHDEERTAQ